MQNEDKTKAYIPQFLCCIRPHSAPAYGSTVTLITAGFLAEKDNLFHQNLQLEEDTLHWGQTKWVWNHPRMRTPQTKRVILNLLIQHQIRLPKLNLTLININ
ncbi:hypothetical protein HanRHA438_Chr09g0416771 [Helianthus annuus]|nr:hypothetical protein HanRHA438_Chr09g0416771 [Helianthus annuus]